MSAVLCIVSSGGWVVDTQLDTLDILDSLDTLMGEQEWNAWNTLKSS